MPKTTYSCFVCGAEVLRDRWTQERDMRRGHKVACSSECRLRLGRRRAEPLVERMMRLVSPEPNSGCWLWTGSLNKTGYGKVIVEGTRTGYAHRVLYEALVGPIPPKLQLDHLCRVPCCVNPAHLEAVTPSVNQRRGMRWPNSPLHIGGSLAF